MQVVIIGGAGFVGSHVVDAQLAAGHDVVIVDDFSRGKTEHVPDDPRVQVIRGDICDPAFYRRDLADLVPDVVYHLAAIHHIPTCEKEPVTALEVNVLGTQRVVDFCREHQVRRLIFASSGAVYDDVGAAPLRESDPLRGRDVYAVSKIAGEALIARGAARGWFCASIARLFNVVGPRETNSHLVPELMRQIDEGVRKIELGNLHPRRDYVHVGDVAQALTAMGEQPSSVTYDVFNVGSGREWTVVEVVAQLAGVAGIELEVESIAAKRREGDRISQLADISKVGEVLGWRPLRHLTQALSDAWLQRTHRHKEAA